MKKTVAVALGLGVLNCVWLVDAMYTAFQYNQIRDVTLSTEHLADWIQTVTPGQAAALQKEYQQKEKQLQCLRWGRFKEQEKASVKAALLDLNPNMTIKEKTIKGDVKGWVEWGGEVSEALAKQKELEFRRAGVGLVMLMKYKKGYGLTAGPWTGQAVQEQFHRVEQYNIKFVRFQRQEGPSEYVLEFGPWPMEMDEMLTHLEQNVEGSTLEKCVTDTSGGPNNPQQP